MATQNLYGDAMANMGLSPNLTSFNTHSLNAATNALAGVFTAEDVANRGPIVGMLYSCASVTSPPTYRWSLQGMTGRAPDGTVKGGGSPASVTGTPSAGVNQVTFANAFTPTDGDILSVVMEYSSGTIGASNFALMNRNFPSAATVLHPYAAINTAGTWSQASNPPTLTPVYQDGSLGSICGPASAIRNNVAASTSYGSCWIPAISAVLKGAWVSIRAAAGSNIQVTLYEGSSTTIASTTVVSQSVNSSCDTLAAGTGTNSPIYVSMPTYTLQAGQMYRLMVSNSGTAYTVLSSTTFTSQTALNAYWGVLAGSTGAAGTFTDYASSTDWRAVPVVPAIQSITEASGGVSAARQLVGMVH